jgi:ribonuclease D
LSARVSVPAENLVTPELVRRLCWDWDPADDDAERSDEEERRIDPADDDAERSDEEERRIGPADDTATAIDEFLAAGHARRWQRELVVPVLAAALQPTPEGNDDVSPAAR